MRPVQKGMTQNNDLDPAGVMHHLAFYAAVSEGKDLMQCTPLSPSSQMV